MGRWPAAVRLSEDSETVRKRRRLFPAFRMAVAEFKLHNGPRFGAALAFYIVFSIAPVMLICVAIAAKVSGSDALGGELASLIAGSFGAAAGDAIATMMRDAVRPVGWLATTAAALSLYFGLSGMYRQIDDALRTIFRPSPASGESRPELVRTRIASMALVAAACIVVFVSVLADAAIALTGTLASSRLAGGEMLWHAAQLLTSSIVLTAVFAVVFRYLPQTMVTWREAGGAAAMTALLFVLGKFALGLYLGKAAVGSAFGAAGSIVVVLLWTYWSAQLFFFGLELTHVHARVD